MPCLINPIIVTPIKINVAKTKVTHHALTMSKMNKLYGVTMPEKGISKLVAVDLQKAETSADLIKQIIGAKVNNSNISAIVEDISKKNEEKYYGN